MTDFVSCGDRSSATLLIASMGASCILGKGDDVGVTECDLHGEAVLMDPRDRVPEEVELC